MDRIASLLTAIVSSFLCTMALIGDFLADVARAEFPPPILYPIDALDADQVLLASGHERVFEADTAGAMFSERARDHRLFIGDGFTLGGTMLPI